MQKLLTDLIIKDTDSSPMSDIVIPNPDNFNPNFSTLGGIVSTTLPYIFAFSGIALLLMIISAGFTLLTSAGDSKKMEAGKQRLTNAVIGFIIIFVAFWLVQLAGYILGVQSIQNIFRSAPSIPPGPGELRMN
jgi:hypothetical protein